MPRRQQHRDFTRSPKRKMSEAQMRSRADYTPLAACEKCGEGEDVKTVETRRGPEMHCIACRRAYHAERNLEKTSSEKARTSLGD